MTNVFDTLAERGFIHSVTDEGALRQALERPLTLYCGYDPTAPSLQVGNLATIMLLVHLQRAGHRVIALMGGGTTMIGDPSFRTTSRPMLTREEIAYNQQFIQEQLGRFLDFSGGRALMLNNADWLLELHYIEFLRDIGRYFSVNEMLAAEAYKVRLETGLSFLEFNYRLLQAYDYLYLYQHYDNILQVGGSDQWGNITAGVDLIRRKEGAQVFGLVIPLITTASGAKMGKSEQGTIYLSADRTSPYDFYQFWINTEDADVGRFLAVFTLLPMAEVRRLGGLQGAELRTAKEVLAYEVTRMVHGEAAAEKARADSRALFGSGRPTGAALEAVPTTALPLSRLRQGMPVTQLLVETGLAGSLSAARRLIEQGGAYVNERRIDDIAAKVSESDLENGELLLRAGKKTYRRVKAD
ncbi:MAG: tyrosine--tRNA ligase [Anaerolineae bacterium]